MNPLRWDVLGLGLLLFLPVAGLGLRGEMDLGEVLNRAWWCLGAAWVAVAVVRWAARPSAAGPGGAYGEGTGEPENS